MNGCFRLQEVASEASKAPGRIPQTIECELTNDLVNSAIPGDVVVVSGIVKLMVDENSMSNIFEFGNVIITLMCYFNQVGCGKYPINRYYKCILMSILLLISD